MAGTLRSSHHTRSHFDNCPLTYEVAGQGDTLLLFVHGWSCRRSYWEPQLQQFASHYQVAALDLAGHGESGAARQQWRIEHFAADLLTVADELTARKVVLVGHSMGGTVTLEAARQLGDRCRGVVLVDTFIIPYGTLNQEQVERFYAPFAADFKGAMAGLVENCSVAATPAALKEQLRDEMGAADPHCALPTWRALLEWSPAAAFAEISCPIHAINCDLISSETRERLAPIMGETVIPGTGHFLQMEQPAPFNAALQALLTRWGL